MKRDEMAALVNRYKIIAILRGIEEEKQVSVARALYDGGVRLLEVTFDQSSCTRERDTGAAIARIKKALGQDAHVGAGTVMSLEEVQTVWENGGEYIIAPNVNEAVIKKAVGMGLGVIPGAMTPTEVAAAYSCGASLVKIFPADCLGLHYCRALRAPLNYIPLVATGGVNDENLQDYLKAGYTGAGIGSSLTNRKLIQEENYQKLKELAARYVKKASY